jgi:hypothetical protein
MTGALLAVALAAFLHADPPGADPAALAVPPETDKLARHLVRQLADREYDTREDASRRLRNLGRLALPALQHGFDHSPSPEAAERCEQLLPRARALDIRARVDCFAADAAGKYRHDLPGGAEFFAATGRTEPARKLFRDLLLSSNRGLLSGIGGPDDALAQAVVARRIELYPRSVVVGGAVQRTPPPTALDVIAVYFVECTLPEKAVTAAGAGAGGVAVTSPTVLLTQPAVQTALNADPLREPMAAIVTRWCETRTEPRTQYMSMTAAANLKLPVATAVAKKVLADKTATPLYKAQAACTVARVGKPADAALLAPLLKDDTQAHPGVVVVKNGAQQRSPVQVRDVALAMSLLLTGQDPTAYGLVSRYAGNAGSQETLRYSYLSYYFDDSDGQADAARSAAVTKWDEWRAKNLDKK